MSSVASKFGSKLANIFSTDKKSSSSAQAHAAQSAAADLEASQERARRELLKLTKTARIGFPYRPTCVAYDPVQHLAAVGTRQGLVKLYGGESVEYTISHVGASSGNGSSGASSASTSTCQSFCSISMQSASSSATDSNNNNTNNGSPVLGASGGGGTAAAYASLMSSSSSSSPTTPAVLFMSFVVNEGALITYCDDSTISFWNLRQKQPGILFSRKLVNEKGTAMCLPFQSSWLFIGTEKGNVYLLNIYNNFSQSGYEMKWNNLIELSQKTKPGKVIHLSEHPLEPSRILIGFDSGLIVLWNLKIRRAESHYYGISETMSSISWFYDGKQFMSAHNNGSLIVWSSKQGETKPLNILHPHMNESDLVPRYNMVRKVAWESTSKNESLIIFSDGLPSADCVMKDAITIIKNNKMKTIIEMKERIIDFIVIDSSPWTSDNPTDPIGLVVLLENNLVVIDLRSEGFPQFQHHHPTGVHESPLTSTFYLSDPNRSFFLTLSASRDKYLQEQKQQQQQLLQQQQQSRQQGPAGSVTASKQVFSSLAYPINGGLHGTKSNVFSYPELLVTGHEDGSVKFWDTSGLGLTLLHKFKTHKLFDKRKLDSTMIEIDSPYKITSLTCTKNFMAVAAAGGHVTLYKYYKKSSPEDGLADIPLFEIPIEYSSDSKSSNESNAHITTNLPSDFINKKELKCFLRTKIGFRRQEGFQPELVCLLYWSQRPPVVTNIDIYTKQNLILFGTDESIVGVDYANRTLLVNVSTVDFYGPQDPFNRGHKSPKKNTKGNDGDDNWADTPHSSAILTKQTTVDPSEKKIRKFGLTNLKNMIESSLAQHESGNDGKKDATSRSSSCSSLENMAQSEGVSCIAINDYAPTTITNARSDYQQQIIQIWLGTTYGSVIVLNLINQGGNGSGSSGVGSMGTSSASVMASSPTGVAGASGSSPVERTICPSGTVYSLKGQLVDISFLDLSGNTINSKCEHEFGGSGTGGASSLSSSSRTKSNTATSNNELDDDDDLDIDLAELSVNNISNSIADNFYSSSATTNNNNTNKEASTNNTSSSANSEFTTFSSNNFDNETSSPMHASNAFMTSFGGPEEPVKSSNKTNKKALSATKSSKTDFGVTQDPGTVVTVSDKSLFAVLTSEHQIKVIGLPSQSCLFKQKINDGVVNKANVTTVNNLCYLTCYLSNGNFLVYNLPNPTLKASLLLNAPPVGYKDKELMDRAMRTFAFGGNGHAVYMCSPSEIQKIYLSTASEQGHVNLTDMLPEFFDPKVVTPVAPKPNLFKSLFSSTPFDREELFGESSGKPSTSIVKSVDGEVIKAKKELTELQKLALERGEKLNALQMKTEEMTMAASAFAKNAHELANKYKSKRFGF